MCATQPWVYGGIAVALAWMYIVLFITMSELLARFDAEARRRNFFDDRTEAVMGKGWYPFRRAGLYLFAVGFRWIGRRRFPGMDFRTGTPLSLVVLGYLQFVLFAGVMLCLAPAIWYKYRCT